MTDKELADRLVASGIGGSTDNRTGDGKEYYEMRKFENGVWTFDYVLETSEFVRDWRVAGAVMEKVSSRQNEYTDQWVTIYETKKDPLYMVSLSGNKFENSESLPRAIIEVGVRELSR